MHKDCGSESRKQQSQTLGRGKSDRRLDRVLTWLGAVRPTAR